MRTIDKRENRPKATQLKAGHIYRAKHKDTQLKTTVVVGGTECAIYIDDNEPSWLPIHELLIACSDFEDITDNVQFHIMDVKE